MTTTYQLPAIGATLTGAELEALPKFSIVVDEDGDAMQKRTPDGKPSSPTLWAMAGMDTDYCHFDDPELEGSTLLWIPETKGQEA